MRVLYKDQEEDLYVCLLGRQEIYCITDTGIEIAEGADMDVIDVGAMKRELRAAEDKIMRRMRATDRCSRIIADLCAEVDAARLAVNLKEMPDLKIINAYLAFLKKETET